MYLLGQGIGDLDSGLMIVCMFGSEDVDFRCWTNLGLEITVKSLSLSSSSTSASTSLSLLSLRFNEFFVDVFMTSTVSRDFDLTMLNLLPLLLLFVIFDLLSNNLPMAWPKIVDLYVTLLFLLFLFELFFGPDDND